MVTTTTFEDNQDERPTVLLQLPSPHGTRHHIIRGLNDWGTRSSWHWGGVVFSLPCDKRFLPRCRMTHQFATIQCLSCDVSISGQQGPTAYLQLYSSFQPKDKPPVLTRYNLFVCLRRGAIIINNNIYFAKGQVNQKGKSPPNLATILTATKQKRQKKHEIKNLCYKHLGKPVSKWVFTSLLEQHLTHNVQVP